MSEIGEILAGGIPAIVSAFTLSVIPHDDDALYPSKVEYALSCKSCDGNAFSLSSFPVIAPDPSPYSEVAPGQTVLLPPHGCKCAKCGRLEALFDARTQGYDGVLNGGCGYESGEGEPTFTVECAVSVLLIYNIELSELRELAEESGVKPADLFDFIEIIGKPLTGGETIYFDYECA